MSPVSHFFDGYLHLKLTRPKDQVKLQEKVWINDECVVKTWKVVGILEVMSDEQSKRYEYKAMLKTGDHATFPNGNNYDDYEQRLLSGIYGISTANGEFVKITPESVQSIEKVEVKDVAT